MTIKKLCKHGNEKKFKNLLKTPMNPNKTPMTKMMGKFIFGSRKERRPSYPIKTGDFNAKKFTNSKKGLGIAWFGHSTVLINIEGRIIITDPVLSGKSVGPSRLPGSKPFDYSRTFLANDMPEIDIVLLSHNHYDHLDKITISLLLKKANAFFAPKNVGKWLEKYGIEADRITEFEWYQEMERDDFNYTFTPSRHFSGRGALSSNTSLWGSWVIKGKDHSVFFSGDGGYSPEFMKIGDRYGPFDLSLIECGAYSRDWKLIHLLPEESVQACLDLKSKMAMPIHWGKFNLAYHAWLEPIQRFSKAANNNNLPFMAPQIGQTINTPFEPKNWWEGAEL